MNVAITSLLVAGLMPIVCAGIAKAGQKNYDITIRVSGWRNKRAIEPEPMQPRAIVLKHFRFMPLAFWWLCTPKYRRRELISMQAFSLPHA